MTAAAITYAANAGIISGFIDQIEAIYHSIEVKFS